MKRGFLLQEMVTGRVSIDTRPGGSAKMQTGHSSATPPASSMGHKGASSGTGSTSLAAAKKPEKEFCVAKHFEPEYTMTSISLANQEDLPEEGFTVTIKDGMLICK